jgi:Glyoxalase-like domain
VPLIPDSFLLHPGDMKSRVDGMWFGVAVEAPDPSGLAHFYSALLEWPIVNDEPGTAIVATPGGGFLVFQEAIDYVRPVWPPAEDAQRPMMHLDVQVGDLESAVGEAVALGATEADTQPNAKVRVLLDPAGHPFCLCVDTE